MAQGSIGLVEKVIICRRNSCFGDAGKKIESGIAVLDRPLHFFFGDLYL